MKKLSDAVRSELEAGVSLTRLSQLCELASSTLRNYENEGLIESVPGHSKKRYDHKALESALEVKALRESGLSLKEIAAKRLGVGSSETQLESTSSSPTADELKARINALREQLAAEKAKLESLVAKVGMRQMQRRNELALTKKELEEIERLRESNVRRALEVTRRTLTTAGNLQYSTARTGMLRMNTPKVPRKKRK